MHPFRNLVEVLRTRADEAPDALACLFLEDGEAEGGRLSRRELDARAREIGGWLRAAGAAGERALLLYPQGLEYVAAFWGCLYGGVVAVPAYPPKAGRGMPRIRAILDDARPKVVLTTAAILDEVRAAGDAPFGDGTRWIATDRVSSEAAERWGDPEAEPGTLAFLQYTSGSTATPKGVMVGHGNLLHNLELMRRGWRQGEDSVVVGWLPLFHDMGLIGNLLLSAYLGAPYVLMPPAAFLQRPIRWLRAVSDHGATLSGAPNFAYDLCAARVTEEQRAGLDLSRWSAAFNGAEPVRAETLERFHAAFAPCGLRRQALQPGYGLAEATLAVATGHRGDGPFVVRPVDAAALERHDVVDSDAAGARRLVGCGPVLDGQRVRIVDPETRAECAPGRTGEIWIAGPSVAQGYWNRPAETEETFAARIVGSDSGTYLRTGDLGFVHDGGLFVTGRRKDLITIRGRNVYPQDVERTLEAAHDGIRPGCSTAFSVEEADEERLVVAAELDRRALRGDPAEVAAALRRAVAAEHDLQPAAVVLLRPGGVPKTTSGKLQRSACRAAFADGTLDAVWTWRAEDPAASDASAEAEDRPHPVASSALDRVDARPGAEEIERWLVERIARRAGMAAREVDPREPFARWGLDSLAATALSGELEEWLGGRLSPTLLYEHPSISLLARHLAGETAESPSADPGSDVRPAVDAGEPIAIVGLSCRFPGAEGADAFWDLLTSGRDAVREVPAERWSLDALYDPDPRAPGKMSTRWGGFVEGVDRFDAPFFSITPREAERMDPQQRLLLEVAWEALEDAGVAAGTLAGSDTGVFVGISGSDYGQAQLTDPALADAYAGTGSALSIAANRLSYALDLRGPSVAVDTACSSSLVALHLACAALASGECGRAIVGGVNLLLAPGITVNFSKAGFMAPDGRCRAFDASAGGYVRGEGAGVVVLKPLSRARADGDRVYAVVRGSAVNQDGRSNGLTAPNPAAQEAVLRAAYRRAGVRAADVQYVEAHGTGTPLGDPIEARAIAAVVGEGRDPGRPCRIGSVKSNIGHLEAAAGIAGIIKVALALRQGRLPASLHFDRPNPEIPFDRLPIRVQDRAEAWPGEGGARIAGVSSFGFGGTNAHVVLADAPSVETTPVVAPVDRGPLPIVLSARSPEALRASAERLRARLSADDAPSLADVAWTAAVRRTHHDHRLAIIAESTGDAAARLGIFLRGEGDPSLAAGQAVPGARGKAAFVFSGQGSQWARMGRALLASEPVFREVIEAVDREVARHAPWSLLEELERDEDSSWLARTEIAQPALFAVQAALAALWRSWGVQPAAVVGHSVGEMAAAYVAGALSLEDAVRVAVHRGRLMERASGRGAMAAVGIGAEDAAALVAPYGDRLAVAVHNAPDAVVLSGEPAALDEAIAILEARGVSARRLPVDYAFHSAQMEPHARELAGALAGLAPRAASIPLFSTVTGAECAGTELDADYWARGVRDPVLFAPAVAALAAAGCTRFVEIGAHPVLSGPVSRSLALLGADGVVVGSLRRGEGERETMMRSLATLFASGVEIDWPRVIPEGRHVRLPSYPWQRERYWIGAGESVAIRTAGDGGPRRMEMAHLPGMEVWEMEIDRSAAAGAASDADALAAVLRRASIPGVGSIDVVAPLAFANGERRTVQVVRAGIGADARAWIYSRPADVDGAAWTLHALAHPGREADRAPSDRAETAEPGDAGVVYLTIRDALAAADDAGRLSLLVDYLREQAGAVLRIPRERVDAGRGLAELGLDSLVSVELRNRVLGGLGVAPALRDLLAGPSLADLAAALLASLRDSLSPAAATESIAPIIMTASAASTASIEVVSTESHASLESAVIGPLEIARVDGEEHPLSYGQEAHWTLQQMHPESGLLNVAAAIRLTGELDAAALRRAARRVVERHPSLRTRYALRDGAPVQSVAAEAEVDWSEEDAVELDDAALAEALEREAYRPFALDGGPLLRLSLLRRGEREHALVIAIHHIATDFWSSARVLHELAALYAAETTGAAAALPRPAARYTDFVRWQRRMVASAEGGRLRARWAERLGGDPAAPALPADFPRPALPSHRGAARPFRLGRARTEALKALARERGTTLYAVLLAAYAALLHRFSGQDDVVVASPMAGRPGPEFADVVGCFMNPVPVRVALGGDPSFGALLERAREATLAALDDQAYPLPLLAERAGGRGAGGASPLLGAMLVLNRPHREEGSALAGILLGEPGARHDAAGLAWESLPLAERYAVGDLCLWAGETDGELAGRLQYDADLFAPETADRLLAALARLADALTADPSASVADAPLLSDEERALVVEGWGAGGEGGECAPAVHRAFERQAARAPGAVALVWEDETVTYGELDRRANRLAHRLRALGVGTDVPVGLLLERSPEMIVGILGILKAGGAYVPLDPAYPSERLALMAEDAGLSVLVARRGRARDLAGGGVSVVEPDADDGAPHTAPAVPVFPGSAAYVIYTSGSTGRPKGVVVPHSALANHTASAADAYGIGPADRVLQFASVSFDASAEEIFPTLARGAALVLAPERAVAGAAAFFAFCAGAGVSVLDLPTAFWHQLAWGLHAEGAAVPPSVRLVIVGGERVLPERAAGWLERAPSRALLVNTYGPTEGTIVATRHDVRTVERAGEAWREVPIGRPIRGARVYVLDPALRPVPVGVWGELAIGGRGVARGYLGRPAMTAGRFVPDPFAGPGARMYATGDVVRWRADGVLEFRGRSDGQVKIRGFRIEPGEVEGALAQHPQVEAAAVVAREDAPGQRRLVAYLAADAAAAPSVRELRAFLKEQLPDYMVPAAFVFLPALPLTPGGKVDRRALPAPEAGSEGGAAAGYVAPRDGAERVLAEVWAEVLDRPRVGAHDNFFELGGDSILGIQVVSRAARRGLRLTPALLFRHQTVAELAAAAGSARAADAEQGPVEGTIPLTPYQRWFFAQGAIGVDHWNMALLLELRRPLDPAVLARALSAVTAHHDALRTRFRLAADGSAEAAIGAPGEAVPVDLFDLSALAPDQRSAEIEKRAGEIQAGLDVARGPVLRAALFACGDAPHRLLLVAHHLVIDGVSWRVLLEDLGDAYARTERGEPLRLPPKTTSYRAWARRLAGYAESDALGAEAAFWLREADGAGARPLPRDFAAGDGEGLAGSVETVTVTLDAEETRALLRDAPRAFGTQVNDVLLAALAEALGGWTGGDAVGVELEGHGREELFDGVDLSRTVGCFTALFPVALPRVGLADPGAAARAVRDRLRALPNRGIGYGILRFLSPQSPETRALAAVPRPEVMFNYLGQVDHALPEPALFTLTGETAGAVRDPDATRPHALEVLGIVAGGRLRAEWIFSRALHRRETVERVAAAFAAALRALAAAASASSDIGPIADSDRDLDPKPAPISDAGSALIAVPASASASAPEPVSAAVPLDPRTLALLREELGDLVS